LAGRGNHHAVGQRPKLVRLQQAFRVFERQPLGMKTVVHVLHFGARNSQRPAESVGIGSCRFAPALEAGAVACRQRDHIVEEEEVCPACGARPGVASKDLALAALEPTVANDPGLRGPAPAGEGLSSRVVNDAAIAREQATRGRSVNLTERIYPVLQWHSGCSFLAASCHDNARHGQRGGSMKVLVIENYNGTPLGQVAVALDEAQAERVHIRPFEGHAIPTRGEGYDALVLLGGAQNALDDENHPWFPATLELIRDFTDADKSVLGVCLGAQLVARAHGGENRIGGHYEFGWHPVELTPAAMDDSVFSALPSRFSIFEWHDDHFAPPADAVTLARTSVAETQAFRIGRATYGTQFHFEADRKQVEDWSSAFSSLISGREPNWETRRLEDGATHGLEADEAGITIARAWVATI
jgi:GMP synthase-like glutamine amidotransferase